MGTSPQALGSSRHRSDGPERTSAPRVKRAARLSGLPLTQHSRKDERAVGHLIEFAIEDRFRDLLKRLTPQNVVVAHHLHALAAHLARPSAIRVLHDDGIA